MRSTRWLWRWRSSPLRRREDVAEAWIILVVRVVVVIGGTVAGLVTARSVERESAAQRVHRHPVRAVLVSDAPHGVTGDWSTEAVSRPGCAGRLPAGPPVAGSRWSTAA
ncbi:hypothetical protein GCM10010260_54260 [Streptomyces filipinensis]|uniref:Uncharacterized protein n=1 Tax=Streptomyces filipinensis TaxID=66887 RepID=A0A918MDP4_9ACTN|nr:hypothetical protein [Streptomyces filipinensis]GGV09164.1 hypothetical protein GCM10010260_54260 [Streptomyces filipinensis]